MKPLCSIAALLVAVAVLAGCGAFPPRDAAPWDHSIGFLPTGDTERLLAYFEYLKRLPPGELHREYNTVRQVQAQQRDDFSRVQLALLLDLPGTGFSDQAKAIELLEPLTALEQRNASVLRLFAYYLAETMKQNKRQQDRAREEQRRADALQQKLEALKAIERSLIERQQLTPGRGE